MKWNSSQSDFYTQLAKKENYPARSVYKLKEIDEQFGLLKKGDKVLDLGCSPGSWLLYIAKKVGLTGKAMGVDSVLSNIKLPPQALFIQADVFREDFLNSLPINNYQAVVSDLAPQTSGIKIKDTADSLFLTRRAFCIAKNVLAPGGFFICKIFEGEGTNAFANELKKSFKVVKRVRPKAVRRGSKELYIVALNFKS